MSRPPGLGGSSAAREITIAALAIGTLAIGTLIGIGTVGYVFLEGWSVLDALHITFITLTTIVFSEVQPLGGPDKLFMVGVAAERALSRGRFLR